MEPSSPALILIHQARLLIGRPLIDALERCCPSRRRALRCASRAAIASTSTSPRMKLVTDDLLANVATEPEERSSWDSGNDGYSSSERPSSEEPASEEPTR